MLVAIFRKILFVVVPVLLWLQPASTYATQALDPTKAGPFVAKSGEYRFAAKFDPYVTQFLKTEIWAKVWYPTGRTVSNAPIAILLHGNHGTCGRSVTFGGRQYRVDDRTDYSTTGTCPTGYVVTPNHLGYDYVASRMATQGFVVVSINANLGITAAPESQQENDPGLIQRRGRMILRHLQLLGQWNAHGGGPASVGFDFRGRLNFSKITLFGHSRGGDGIIAAYNLLRTSSVWRSRLPSNARIVALASMAPTDFQVGHPNARGTALSVLLPMCDGDVNRLSGIGFYDRSVFPGKDTAGNYKSVFAVWGTNHDGYNTQWQTDDDWQVDFHNCPGQNKLFVHPIGLSAKQQAIGRYFLMGVARSRSQGAGYGELFNPAYTLPVGLRSFTRIDRSYFVGTANPVWRILRFDNKSCGQTLLVTTGVQGTCLSPSNQNGAPPEHDTTTSAARLRWNQTQRTGNAAIFVLNNGHPVNLSAYKTIDMRVGPDCFLVINDNFKGCTGVSPTGGTAGSQNVLVYLKDTNNHYSRGVPLHHYAILRAATGVAYPPGPAPFPSAQNGSPLYHAILSSARIPLGAFARAGFNSHSVKQIYVGLGGGSSRGGLYFGDVSAVADVPATVKAVSGINPGVGLQSAGADSERQVVMAQALTPPAPAGLPFLSAGASGAADASGSSMVARAAPLSLRATSAGSIVSATRSSMPVALGASPDSTPENAPMGTAATVEFTLSTPEPLADTSDAGFSMWIGGRSVQARYFATGRENATPSVTKLVVPASVVDSAPEGASVMVTSATGSWRFGALNKGSIR